jgi:hypothetical protein
MRALLIADRHPQSRHLPHLLQTAKEIEVEDLISIHAIESLDKGILPGASRLNVIDQHPIDLPPLGKLLRQKFWAVIHSDHVGVTLGPLSGDPVPE